VIQIEKFAPNRAAYVGEFLDHHTRNTMILVSLLIPKFARDAGFEVWRTAESGH